MSDFNATIRAGYYSSLAQYCAEIVELKALEAEIHTLELNVPPAYQAEEFQRYLKQRAYLLQCIRVGERLATHSWSGIFQYGEVLELHFRLETVARFQTRVIADASFCKYVRRRALLLIDDHQADKLFGLEEFLAAYSYRKKTPKWPD